MGAKGSCGIEAGGIQKWILLEEVKALIFIEVLAIEMEAIGTWYLGI